MELNQQKEQFSLAYIRAVAAHAGYQVARPESDMDSIDGMLIAEYETRPQVNFQAKSTSHDLIRGEGLSYELPLKNYNDLRIQTMVPRILIVVLMPASTADWLTHSEQELILRKCGYWISLANYPETSNRKSVTVSIPRANLFDTAGLAQLMDEAANGAG